LYFLLRDFHKKKEPSDYSSFKVQENIDK
jgi:hypothetical protein